MNTFTEAAQGVIALGAFLKRQESKLLGIEAELDEARVDIQILQGMLDDAGISLTAPVDLDGNVRPLDDPTTADTGLGLGSV